MSANKDGSFSLPNTVIQHGRTAFHQNLIGKKVEEIYKLTGDILRWPIPRPLLKRQLNQALGVLAWSGGELSDSLARDRGASEAVAFMAQEMVIEAGRITIDVAGGAMPELVSTGEVLDYNAAAETAIAIINDSRLSGSNSTDLIA